MQPATKSKYRGAPVAGAAGFYKGRGYERPSRTGTSTTELQAYTYDGTVLAALLVLPEAEEQVERQTHRAMLRDQVSQLRQQQLRDQLRYLRQQGLIDV
jgi:hypothetical protein